MGVKFDAKDIHGKQIEVVTKTSDMLVSILKSSSATTETIELATKILDYIAHQVQEHADLPQLDQAAYRMLAEFQADCVWTGLARLETQMAKGVLRQVFVVKDKATA